jgi:hypothetical protein
MQAIPEDLNELIDVGGVLDADDVGARNHYVGNTQLAELYEIHQDHAFFRIGLTAIFLVLLEEFAQVILESSVTTAHAETAEPATDCSG